MSYAVYGLQRANASGWLEASWDVFWGRRPTEPLTRGHVTHNMCAQLGVSMANITLSVDEKTVNRAREAAQAMGTSLNQLVREHIERLAGADQRAAEHTAYEARVAAAKGRLNGWKFDRDEANARG